MKLLSPTQSEQTGWIRAVLCRADSCSLCSGVLTTKVRPCLHPTRKRKKNITSNILTHTWSIKWSLFTKLFSWMGCKSRDESNEPT